MIRALHRRPSEVARKTSARGFGLLEVIVALAILGTSGVALFVWIHQSLESASRVRAAEARARLTMTASAWVATVNPMLRPTGVERVAAMELRWTSRLLEEARQNRSFDVSQPGAWETGLYSVSATALDVSTGVRVDVEQWQVGYRRSEAAPVASGR